MIALHHIELRRTVHRPEPSADPTLVFATSAPEAARHLQAILDAIAGRVLLKFPSTALRFDGRVHAIELDLGSEQVRFRFEMPDERGVPQTAAGTSPPLVAGLCLAGLVTLWLVLKRRRSCARGRSLFGARPLG